MSAAATTHTKKSNKKTRTPVARAVRKLVGSFGGLIDDVVDRGAGVERDTRHLVNNLFKSSDQEEKKASKRHDDDREEVVEDGAEDHGKRR